MNTNPFTNVEHASEHEHEAPGGSTVNRVAKVATSAALGGAAAGALAGAVAGPVGAAVGAAVGAVAAGVAGNAVAASVDAKAEQAYWRDNYADRPYVDGSGGFDDYSPAYAFGVASFVRHGGRRFDDVEAELSRDWPASRGSSTLEWERARHASRDAWSRLQAGADRGAALPPDRAD